MAPYAYGLRVHDISKGPHPVDHSLKFEKTLPDDWKPYLDSPALHQTREGFVEVLPLFEDSDRAYMSGWTTSGWMAAESPEMEVISGGINTKRPSHVSIWRQGNLLHFGYEPPPSGLNDAGQALLANSIAYISRFTEDRPLTKTPSVFADKRYPRTRGSIEELLGAFAPSSLGNYFAHDLRVKRMRKPALREWYAQERDYISSGDGGLLDIDENAKAFGTPFDDERFVEKAIGGLKKSKKKRELSMTLLTRYVAEPPSNASYDSWQAWHDENKDYLFFSEGSGFLWHIDPLAKKRGVPSAELRGAKRATLDPPAFVNE